MGIFNDLIKMMLKDNNIDDERTIRALNDEGENDADEIAEELGQKEDKTAFVPKVDVPPVELPKGCEINEFGEIIRKDNKDEDNGDKVQDERE